VIDWRVNGVESPDGDRKLLAALLLELARSLNRDVAANVPSFLGSDPRLAELRHIVLGREQAVLARLQHTIEDPAHFAAAVSEILPAAILEAAARNEQLGQVLAPMVEFAAETSIRRDPRTLVNILYPLVGPAIRKSAAEALEATVQSLNQALRHSLSWRGLKWRLEAWRTGASFAQTVLKHTLVYRVEHVFLIHRRTGLLLEHVATEEEAGRDPQLISGMLTAIQDFVRDSFSDSGEGGLDTLRLGEFLLWCEQGPQAFLVAVMRGTPPENLHELMRDTLERIHADRREALHVFEGDASVFAEVRNALAGCLQQQAKPPERGTSPLLWAIPLLVALMAGSWLYLRIQDDHRMQAYAERLGAEPGIVVTGYERRGGLWHVSGLRDPLASDPQALLDTLEPERVVGHWQPFQALHPEIALKRLQASLEPPPTVALSVESGAVRATGTASHNWIKQARERARLMPVGSPALDLSALTNVDLSEFNQLREAIQARAIHFDLGVPTPAAGQEGVIEGLAADLRELANLARRQRLLARVTIIGHADSVGRDTSNLALTVARAEVVRSQLLRRNVDPELLFVRGAGTMEPLQAEATERDRSLNRRVSFNVGLID
jgi:OOP family OmpA-OmpF porin